jgi:hypothetical protein
MRRRAITTSLLAIISITSSPAGEKHGERSFDLEVFRDPAKRIAEAERRFTTAGDDDDMFRWVLKSFSIFDCPARDGAEPIVAMLYRNELVDTTPPDGYELDKSLFVDEVDESVALPFSDKATPARLHDQVLVFADAAGKEVTPFGGNNMISDGYLFDINGDGLLEQVDTGYSSFGEGATGTVVEVETVEPNSRVLFRVLVNWEVDGGDEDETEWSYSCADIDGDGSLELCFGPMGADGDVVVERLFRWSGDLGTYVASDGKEGGVLELGRVGRWSHGVR